MLMELSIGPWYQLAVFSLGNEQKEAATQEIFYLLNSTFLYHNQPVTYAHMETTIF